MKVCALCISIATAFPIAGSAQTCDCTIWPFDPDPPCESTCVAQVLVNVPEEVRLAYFNLSSDLEGTIREVKNSSAPGALFSVISDEERDDLIAQFRELPPGEMEAILDAYRQQIGS